jgi:hypothetical protein
MGDESSILSKLKILTPERGGEFSLYNLLQVDIPTHSLESNLRIKGSEVRIKNSNIRGGG